MSKKSLKQVQIPKTPIWFIVYASKPYKWWAFAAIIAVILGTALNQSSAIVFKWMVSAIENGETEKVLLIGILYPFLMFCIQLINRSSIFFGLHWGFKTEKHIGDILFSYSTKHSHTYFSDRFAGSLLNKMNNVMSATDSLIFDFLLNYLTTTVSLAITFYFIFTIDPLSGFLFLVFLVVLIVVNILFVKRKRQLSLEAAAAGSKMRGSIVDVFSNITAVRQFSRHSDEIEKVDNLGEKWRLLRTKSFIHTEITLIVNSLLMFVFFTAVFYMMSHRWSDGLVTTGEFVFAVVLFAQITNTLTFIGRAMTNYARVRGELEEGLEELIVPYEITDTSEAKSLAVSEGAISFESVQFSFGENSVFEDFNLTIKPGERVGLVGHSGAGKTTFVSLLLRQHDVVGGTIKIDGQDISLVTQDSLRNAIAVVPQEPMLFHRTIRENITYGKQDATEKEIIEAATRAQAHEFITALEHGYDTLVGERGVKLSGGQKQRVAIARAMLKDAPILILDEATSALDSESEVAIQTALHKLMEGKTVVAIAHRLSTLREMDRIIVLENGKIIEDGMHDSLKSAGGVYQRLWEHQAGGFLAE